MTPGSVHVRARLAVVAATILFSTGGAAVKATELGGWQVAGLRSGIAAVFLALVAPRARRALLGAARGRGGAEAAAPAGFLGLALVGVCYAATLVLFVNANKLTTAANTIFLQGSAPLWIVLLSPWLLRVRPRARDVASVAVVALGGALALSAPVATTRTASDPVLGNALAAATGLTYGLVLIGLQRLGADPGSGRSMAAVVLGNAFAFLACAPFALPLADVSAADWLAVTYLGVLQIGAAYLLLTFALQHLTSLETALLLLLEPILNPLFAWLLHGERAHPRALVGGALIALAVLARNALSRRRPAPAPSRPRP